jgi:hydroxymethylbilane synthase
MRVLRIGTRGSALARWQSDDIRRRLEELTPSQPVEVVEITSLGDTITDVPLSHVEGTGFFTASIERALSTGDVDVAVHSFKDLPVDTTAGLIVAATPPRAPVEDVLCARDGLTLDQLPRGARVGTCSARRTAQVLAARPDLSVGALRGNVPTRIGRVGTEFDAIVLARAGLVRLGLARHITEVFGTDRVLPAPAQGALAVQCRADDLATLRLLAALDDARTRMAVTAERTLLHALGGGCSVPVGAFARVAGDGLEIVAGVFGLRSATSVNVILRGTDPVALGHAAARELVERGAAAILAEFEKAARLEAAFPGDRS